MQVAITCRHGELQHGVQEYIQRKSEKLLTYFERVTAIEVTVDFEKDRSHVEILVDAEHRNNFVSQEVGEEVAPAFDRALHKMEQQIRKHKEKIQDHRRDRRMNEMTADTGEGEEEDE